MDIDNYSYDFEGRKYLNPAVAQEESMGFIDNLRDIQAKNNQQIQTQTHNMGLDVQPRIGGLSGGGDYFKSRYQTPQTNATIANLKAAAQLSALNTVLNNAIAQAKQRYTKTQQDAAKKAATPSTPTNDGGDGSNLKFNTDTGATDSIDVNDQTPTGENTIRQSGTTASGGAAYDWTEPLSGKHYIISTPPTSFSSMTQQSDALGVWPNGARKTVGSRYTAPNGKTYAYLNVGAYPATYEITYSFGG